MAKRVPWTGSEKDSLRAALDRQREAVLWKISGLSDAQLRRSMVPSGTSLLGVVKHLAAVEYGWFCETFGRPTGLLPSIDYEADEDSDLRVADGETTEEILDFYRRACVAADESLVATELDAVGTAWDGPAVSMRWVAIHMLEEDARHLGHLDILRELIDGATGDHDRSAAATEPAATEATAPPS